MVEIPRAEVFTAQAAEGCVLLDAPGVACFRKPEAALHVAELLTDAAAGAIGQRKIAKIFCIGNSIKSGAELGASFVGTESVRIERPPRLHRTTRCTEWTRSLGKPLQRETTLQEDRLMEGLWGFVIIGGPIILGAVLLWAMMNNRMSRPQKEASDEAVRRVRRETAEESHKAGDT
jgi:hypothetical protein